MAKREDQTNGLTHKLAYISGRSGEEWADLDEGKSMIRNQFPSWAGSSTISTFFQIHSFSMFQLFSNLTFASVVNVGNEFPI